MSDPNDPADKEHFGEASLGEAQADDPADDPEMIEGDAGAPAPDSDEALTDIPALEPASTDATVDEQEEAAAAEAGAIGGATPDDGLSEAERPLSEAGEGESEGFELAEEGLIESASHGDSSGNPLGDRFTPEEAESKDLSSYGEADDEHVSEDRDDDHS